MGHKKNRPGASAVTGKECQCAPVACFGDKTQHNSGTITQIMDQHMVLIGGRPVARVGDIATYPRHGNSPIYQECLVNVLVNGKRVARMNDRLICGCIDDDYIATGNPTVLIGGITPEMLPLAMPGKGEFVKVGYYHAKNSKGKEKEKGVKCSFNIYTQDSSTLLGTVPADSNGEGLLEVPKGTGSVIFEPCDLQEAYKIFREYEKKANPLYQKSTVGWVLDNSTEAPPMPKSKPTSKPKSTSTPSPKESAPSPAPTGGEKDQDLENWDMGSLGPKLSGALSSSAEWIWDVLSGDFVEDPSMGQIICRGVLYFIPFIGKALDAQDIAACLYLMLWKGRYKEPMLWFMLVVTLIGCVPVVGDAAKLCLKAIGKGGGKTVHSIVELFETLNLVGKGNGLKFLKELAADLPGYGKIAAEKITAILGFIADKLTTIKKWAVLNSSVVAKVDEVFEGLRWMEKNAGEMCAKITDELADKLKDLIKNFKKQKGTAPTTKMVPEHVTGSIKQEAKVVDDRWRSAKIDDIKWDEVENVRKSARGAVTGVYFVTTKEGSFIIKPAYAPGNEAFALSFAKKFGIETPDVKIRKVEGDWLGKLHDAPPDGQTLFDNSIAKDHVLVLSQVDGKILREVDPGDASLILSSSNLQHMGEMAVFDMVTTNGDRFPLTSSHAGNQGNLMFNKSTGRPVAIDQAIDTSMPTGENYSMVSELINDVGSQANAPSSVAKKIGDWLGERTGGPLTQEQFMQLEQGMKNGIKKMSSVTRADIDGIKSSIGDVKGIETVNVDWLDDLIDITRKRAADL